MDRIRREKNETEKGNKKKNRQYVSYIDLAKQVSFLRNTVFTEISDQELFFINVGSVVLLDMSLILFLIADSHR